MDLRKQFFKTLSDLAKDDPSVVLLVGDLGFSFFESFRDNYPAQFINVGIMEQTMIGIAAGLALGGKKPYCYSTAPFVTYRVLEQIRDDVAYQNLNVKLIGTNMSGFIGFTHTTYDDEDLHLFKKLPNIKAYAPKDEKEAEEIIKKTYEEKTPTYIRV
jgi:transketolase